MIEFRPMAAEEITAVKRLILAVARPLYQWDSSVDELLARFDRQGEFADIDDFQAYYIEQDGLFLVALDNGRLIGSGAVRRLDEQTAELKRLWLLEPYQGRGIGYRLLQSLIAFARENGYRRLWLETDHEQERAIRFYRQVGFRPIEKYNQRNNDYYLGLEI